MEEQLTQLGRAFWQFQIAGVPLPHLKVRGRVGRREGEYWLKVWNERLLFCAADAPERVFAVVTPCENERDLAEFWRAAVERGNFGELSAASHHMVKPSGWLNAVILKANNRRSWVRDWCGGDWIEFVGPKFPADFPQDALAASEYDAMFKLWHRLLPESERNEQSLFWLRGSLDEWKHVLQACATIQYKKNPNDIFGYRIQPGERHYSFPAHSPFCAGVMEGTNMDEFDGDVWPIPDSWNPLFMQHFVPIGWNWECGDKKAKSKRCSWRTETSWPFSVIQLSLHPSQHELLEARLFLRDWLRGKVHDEQIAGLLE